MHFKSRTSSYRRILSFLIIFLFTFNSIVVAAPLDTSSLRAISAKQSVIVPEGLQEELQVTLENKTSSSGEQKLTVFQKFMGKNPAIEAMIKSKGFTGTVTKVNIKDAIRFLDSVGDFDIYTYNDGKKSAVEIIPPRKSAGHSSKTSSSGVTSFLPAPIANFFDGIAESREIESLIRAKTSYSMQLRVTRANIIRGKEFLTEFGDFSIRVYPDLSKRQENLRYLVTLFPPETSKTSSAGNVFAKLLASIKKEKDNKDDAIIEAARLRAEEARARNRAFSRDFHSRREDRVTFTPSNGDAPSDAPAEPTIVDLRTGRRVKTSSAGWQGVYDELDRMNEKLRDELGSYTAGAVGALESTEKFKLERETLQSIEKDSDRERALIRLKESLKEGIISGLLKGFNQDEFFNRLSEASGVPKELLKDAISVPGNVNRPNQVTNMMSLIAMKTNRLKVKKDLLDAMYRHMKNYKPLENEEQPAILISDQDIPYRGHIVFSLLDKNNGQIEALEKAMGYKIRLLSQYSEEEDGPANKMMLLLSDPLDALTAYKILFNSLNPKALKELQDVSNERSGKKDDAKSPYKYPMLAEIFERPAIITVESEQAKTSSAGSDDKVTVTVTPMYYSEEGFIFKINTPDLPQIEFEARDAKTLSSTLSANFMPRGYSFDMHVISKDKLRITRRFSSNRTESVDVSFNMPSSEMETLLAKILRLDGIDTDRGKTSSSGIDFSSMDEYTAEALLTKHLLDYSPKGEIAVDVSQQAIIIYSDVLKNSPALQDAIRAGNGDSRRYYLVNKEGVPAEEFLDGIGLAKSWFENYILDAEGKSSVNIVDAITVVLQRNNIKQARVFAQAEEDLKAWSAQDVIETLIMLLKDKVFEIISDYADLHEDYIRAQEDILSAA